MVGRCALYPSFGSKCTLLSWCGWTLFTISCWMLVLRDCLYNIILTIFKKFFNRKSFLDQFQNLKAGVILLFFKMHHGNCCVQKL